MFYYKPLAFALTPLIATVPLILHSHASPDCNPRITLCSVSDALYLPDDPAPKPQPQLILAPPVAGSTVSMPSNAILLSAVERT
jgi:hypothetical protein